MSAGQWDIRPGETPIDLSGLVDRGSIRTRGELYAAEAANILQAFEYYAAARERSKRLKFTYDWLLAVHKRMFCDVWTWAGEIRKENLNLGAPWHLVGQQLSELVDDVAAWPVEDSPLLEHSAVLHHRAVQIHPFPNGNGRWARFIANLWLRKHGGPEVIWPEESFSLADGGVRDEYLRAIVAADNFDLGPLIALHARFSGSA
jgi:Fic-DOC domain mobile mystery protein B